jgi:glycosyltransferase involved in cell wall biosynthesis
VGVEDNHVLVVLTTHPIQYQSPLWQAIAKDGAIPFEVWYLTRHNVGKSLDREFQKLFTWDINLLAGYKHRFLRVHPEASPNSFWNCRFVDSFEQMLRANAVKVLWVQGWQVAAYWQAIWAANRIGVKVWLRGESNDLAAEGPGKRLIKRLLLGQLFRRVDLFFYIGAANKRLYSRYGVPQDRLLFSPYAVDNERFKQQAALARPHRMAIRRAWGIPDDAFVVLFCGKFIPKKRPLDVVNAMAVMNTKDPSLKCHALFVGSGELGPELRASCDVTFDADNYPAHASAVEDKPLPWRPPASFAGFLNQTEISRAYVAADCLALPSDHGETWGLVVNEAMASGLPCVVSDACGCAENLGLSDSVVVFALGNIPAMAEALQKLSGHSKRVTDSQDFISLFSLQQTVDLVSSLHKSTL